MKRLGSSDSLGAFISISPTKDEDSPRMDHICSREFQSMLDGLDEEGCVVEESGGGHVAAGKKRRLSVDQVKALEKNFELENKLEPDRKLKLSQELGLQPRQVAVWFQNRRARWKTKQLERDYGLLKTSYDTLKADYDALQHVNEALLKEIRELNAKLNGDQSSESNLSVKEEVILPETDYKTLEQSEALPMVTSSDPPPPEFNYESANNNNNGNGSAGGASTLFPDLKDGPSDSTDSSAISNEDITTTTTTTTNNNNNNGSPNLGAIYSSGVLQSQQHLFMSATTSSSLNFNSSSSSSSSPPASMDCFQFSKTTYQSQPYVKMEEHNFISADEACNFFSDEQAPSLHWYCPEQWN